MEQPYDTDGFVTGAAPPQPSIFALGERIGRLERIAGIIKARRIPLPDDNRSADTFLHKIFADTDPNVWANHRRYWMARRIYEKAMSLTEHEEPAFKRLLEERIDEYAGKKRAVKRAHRPTLLVGVGDTLYWDAQDGHYTSVIMALNDATGMDYAVRHFTSGAAPELRLAAEEHRLSDAYPDLNVKTYTGTVKETRKGRKVLGIAI